MSRKKNKSSPHSPPKDTVKTWLRRHTFWLYLGLAAVAVFGSISYFNRDSGDGSPAESGAAHAPQPIVPTVQKAFTLTKLLAMKPEELKDVDIAEMNLLCATGLPGAEKLDVAKCMKRLDEWASLARYETDRHMYRAHDTRYADHFRHSENWLRAEMLAQTLQEECGVHYNMQRITKIDFRNTKDLMIHGMIDDPNGGTCASMPVLYTAVGRRLGYPLKLVLTKSHIFVRWDDDKERFNVETTSNGGTDSHPDDYYKQWPEKITDAEAKANGWLLSLSPKEELAEFLANRGHCGLDNGHPDFAARCYENAYGYDPTRPCYRDWFLDAAMKCDYHPVIPALAGLLKDRIAFRDFEFQTAQRETAARREWFRTHQRDPMPGEPAPGVSVGWPSTPGPGIPQPPPSYAPPSGLPQPRQPRMPGEQPGP